jgi:hypothetical protein
MVDGYEFQPAIDERRENIGILRPRDATFVQPQHQHRLKPCRPHREIGRGYSPQRLIF